MKKQLKIVFVGVLSFAIFLSLNGCASAPTPTSVPIPTATAPIPPPPSVTSAPSVAPTKPPATATTAPSPAATTKPTTAATAAPAQPPAQSTTSTTTAAVGKDVCLGCHGPFDKLVSASANYVWPNGDKKSPHRYVPHDSKNIAECSTCHKPHPVPPTASDIAAMGKPNPQSCLTCHHTGALECGTCHEIPEAIATPKP